jgi:hypothetical protein
MAYYLLGLLPAFKMHIWNPTPFFVKNHSLTNKSDHYNVHPTFPPLSTINSEYLVLPLLRFKSQALDVISVSALICLHTFHVELETRTVWMLHVLSTGRKLNPALLSYLKSNANRIVILLTCSLSTKRLRREAINSPQFSAEFKLVWIHLQPSFMP